MGQLTCLEKITSVRRQGNFAQKNQVSKAPTSFLTNRSSDKDHKNLSRSNKLRFFEAFVGSKALVGPPQALPPTLQDLGAN